MTPAKTCWKLKVVDYTCLAMAAAGRPTGGQKTRIADKSPV
jgi:hypothetical protein